MEIDGEWLLCNDEVSRPVVHAKVLPEGGKVVTAAFLIDTAADRTVFGADLLNALQPPVSAPPPGYALQGVGGDSTFVLVSAVIELASRTGTVAKIKGDFAALLDQSAIDLNVLGRDVLNHFDLIVARHQSGISLLTGGHGYTIQSKSS
jgi:hypothetical protein